MSQVKDCKPYEFMDVKQLTEKMRNLDVNESFLAYNVKSAYNDGSARMYKASAQKNLSPKKFHMFKTPEGLRVFRMI